MTAVLLFVMAGWTLLGVVGTIFAIGKKREPMTQGRAAFVILISLGMITILVIAALQLIGASA